MLVAAALGIALLPPAPQSPDVLEIVFSEVERRLICEHYEAACRQPRPGGHPDSDEDGEQGKKDNGKGKGKNKAKGKDKDEAKGGGGPGASSGLPPGLARRASLPPGLQKQLDERGRLPPGLAKRALPDGLRDRLPGRRAEVEIVIVDRDVLLIQAATGFVYDVIAGIVRD